MLRKYLVPIIVTALACTLRADPAPTVSPEADKLLGQIAAAYAQVHSMRLTGTMQLTGNIDGRQISRQGQFTAAFDGPGKFRHHFNDDLTIARDGEKLSVFIPADNTYSVSAVPAGGHLSDFPDPIHQILATQNLPLALALSQDARQELLNGATNVTRAPDVTIDGKACPALAISLPERDLTIAVDPTTHLVLRLLVDPSRGLRKRGADVKSAQITTDFATSTNIDIKPDELAMDIPPTAQEIPLQGGNANDLEGKPAPDFRLVSIDGAEISSNKLKGDVYILDFWATWCGPCQESLPGLDKIYQQDSKDGLKVYAVNLGEDAATVRQFVARTGLSIPVLLDSEGAAGAAYGADAIPETVLVGNDGKVRKVFIGAGNEQAIADAAQAALHDAKH